MAVAQFSVTLPRFSQENLSCSPTPARGTTTPRENVEAYVRACQEAGKVLSPYEYGEAMGGAGTNRPGNRYLQRFKRMFNNVNGTSKHLKEELLGSCLDPIASSKFLDTHFPRQ